MGTHSIGAVADVVRSMAARIAIVASEREDFCDAVREFLKSSIWNVEVARGGAEALAAAEEAAILGGNVSLILDSFLPDLDTEEVASMAIQLIPTACVVTAERRPKTTDANVEVLWRAIRYAEDSLGDANPSSEDMKGSRSVGIETREDDVNLKHNADHAPLPGMIGSSEAMCRMYRLVRLVAKRDTTVLITGETGTGKELVARAVHQQSDRANGPFVTVNCSAIPDTLLESELFGHAKGAFTGALQSKIGRIQAADGGTIFLDEIGEISPAMQAKLLRFLQEGEIQRLGETEPVKVDVRVIAATNIDLTKAARQQNGSFRQDLFFRLAVFPIELPALRKRGADPLLLACYFLAKLGAGDMAISREAEELLLGYDWPGNVRELQHAIERGVILADGGNEITREHLLLAAPVSEPLVM